ncbi:MAG: SusD/RagB family nutrient-binding outer membrane lipoprotein, partial [Bacteroidota bacterium]
MTKYINKILFAVATTGLLFAGCTDRFEEFNKNPNGATNQDITGDLIPTSLKIAQQNIYVYQPAWVTQLQQNLLGDVYSGYMMPPTPFRGNNNNMTYDLVDGWNSWAFIPAYDNVMVPISTVEELTSKEQGKQDLYAMAKIIKVEAMHRVSDLYGPIIYTNYKKEEADGSILYDTQEQAYNQFFADLKTAIDILTPIASNASSGQFASSDLVYGGSYAKWLKFANTLRLRLAIRIAKVDPAKAKAEGEAALANAGGLITGNSENFLIDFGATNHPLNVINNEW